MTWPALGLEPIGNDSGEHVRQQCLRPFVLELGDRFRPTSFANGKEHNRRYDHGGRGHGDDEAAQHDCLAEQSAISRRKDLQGDDARQRIDIGQDGKCHIINAKDQHSAGGIRQKMRLYPAVGAEQEADDERSRIDDGDKGDRRRSRPEAMQQWYRKEQDHEHDINGDDRPKLAIRGIENGESQRNGRHTPTCEIEDAKAPCDLLWVSLGAETECSKQAHRNYRHRDMGQTYRSSYAIERATIENLGSIIAAC